MPLSVASLHLYPIKSLGGFHVSEAHIGDRGFVHDRRWMLVDGNGRFITQRENALLALLHCTKADIGFRVTDIRDGTTIDLPWAIISGDEAQATIFNDEVSTLRAPREVSDRFARKLAMEVSLVFMPDHAHRPVNTKYAQGITSLSDGFPYLIISQASLNDLNGRLEAPLPMARFRPNIVISGGEAYQEDAWKEIGIGDARFSLVKPCERCVIPTTDQRTGERGKEPLRTLATYRARNNAVLFGMNAMALDGAIVRTGDLVSKHDPT